MIQYSKDTNYLDEASRKADYEETAKEDTVTGYKIVESKSVSDSEVDLSVQFTYSDIGTIPVLPFSIHKYTDGWKVLIEPIEVNVNKDSADYGKVKKGTPEYKVQYFDNSGKISTKGVAIDYYSFDNIGGTSLTGLQTFDISQPTVTIRGAQTTSPNTINNTLDISVVYEIIKKNTNGVITWFGQKTVKGTYTGGGDAYYEGITLTQKGITNARIRITNTTGNQVFVSGSGNVYENQ